MFELRNRMNNTKLWSADDINQMAALLQSGGTIRDVSEQLGRSQEAVRNKARLLGMLPKRSK